MALQRPAGKGRGKGGKNRKKSRSEKMKDLCNLQSVTDAEEAEKVARAEAASECDVLAVRTNL